MPVAAPAAQSATASQPATDIVRSRGRSQMACHAGHEHAADDVQGDVGKVEE